MPARACLVSRSLLDSSDIQAVACSRNQKPTPYAGGLRDCQRCELCCADTRHCSPFIERSPGRWVHSTDTASTGGLRLISGPAHERTVGT